MNIFSILRLSLHNLWNNKLRTLLTVIVLTVVSFVMVLLAGVGYSFYRTLNANVNYLLSNSNSDISVSYYYIVKSGDNNFYMTGYFTGDQVDRILSILDGDEGYITKIGFFEEDQEGFNISGRIDAYVDGYNNPSLYRMNLVPYYGGSNPFIGTSFYEDGESYLAAGRMWNADDTGTKNCWLDKEAMSEYKVGDTIKLYRTERNNYGVPNETPKEIWREEYTIAGFLNVKKSWSNNVNVYIDYKQFNDEKSSSTGTDRYANNEKMLISDVYATMIPQEGYTYGVKAQNYLKNVVKRLGAEIVPTETGTVDELNMNVRCDILSSMQLATILSLVIIALIVIVCLIIMLLSIGCVANTIKISAEQNRRFFGVMKAIGMKNKSLRHILIGQIIIMTVIGVALASLASYLMIGVAESIIATLVSSMFPIEEPIIICGISPIIPFAVAFILIGFVLLFTRSSLHEFSRMDVISVINEVN